jgi:AraC-like DNA-binding protein
MKQKVVRNATLFGYLEAAREVGIDGEALMAKAGLSNDYADYPDALISADAVINLLNLSSSLSKRSDFGALASIARGVPDYGPVSLLLREEETLGDALRTLSWRLPYHSDCTYLELDTRFGNPFLSFQIISKLQNNQVSEYCACGLVQTIRWLVGADWHPDAVCFEHPRPAHTSAQSNLLRCELRYNQMVGGILLGRDALNLKVITSHAAIRRQAKALVEHSLAGSPARFEVQVARVMTLSLSDANCDADSIASKFGMNRRTLHRRLASQGLSYSTLLQQIRYETAKRLVESGTAPLTDIAEATGFSSQSAFSRWFQTAFGCSVTDWKRKHCFTTVSS